jgi:hypothetical protein
MFRRDVWHLWSPKIEAIFRWKTPSGDPWHRTDNPSGKHTNSDIENGPVEIVDLAMKNGWIFPVRYVAVYHVG